MFVDNVNYCVISLFSLPSISDRPFIPCSPAFVLTDFIEQSFPKCAPRIPRVPRPVPRGSVDTFL
jgi:hypothetical protein